jgi:hypothetical protein
VNTSDSEIARERAAAHVRWALRDLAANVLRVIRGAGKPHEIGQQAQVLLETFGSYREATGTFPSHDDVSSLLSVERDLDNFSGNSALRAEAQELVLRSALRVIAARLLDQRTQESVGLSELWQCINDLCQFVKSSAAGPLPNPDEKKKRR